MLQVLENGSNTKGGFEFPALLSTIVSPITIKEKRFVADFLDRLATIVVSIRPTINVIKLDEGRSSGKDR